MVSIEITNFAGPYAALNGTHQLPVSQMSLLRAMVTVGHKGTYSALKNLGPFGFIEHIAKAMNYLNFNKQGLSVSNRFFSLESSEKVPVTYRIGQALTKIFAEEYLNIPFLQHVRGISQIHFQRKASPKIILDGNTIHGAEPDLVGLDCFGQWHAFEAKGRSGSISNSLIQKGVNQVSRLQSVNGAAPATRVVCCFNTTSIPISGKIVDPTGIDLGMKFDFLTTKFFYSYFKDLLPVPGPKKFFNERSILFVGSYENYLVGIDFDMYYKVVKGENLNSILSTSQKLMKLRNSSLSEESVSIGGDGIIVWKAD